MENYMNASREEDPRFPYRPKFVGTFERTVMVGGIKRKYLMYLPEGFRSATSGIMVLGPNGKTAHDVWKNSHWRALADQESTKEKLIVVFLEPWNGEWDLDESYGYESGDVAYTLAVFNSMRDQSLCCIHEAKVYLVGYEEGGVMANMVALWNPAVFAGIVSVGGSSIPQEFLQSARNALCTDFDGFIDNESCKRVKKCEIALPAWIIDDPFSSVGKDNGIVAYWKKACGVSEIPHQIDPDVMEYRREVAPAFPIDQETEAYRVWTSNIEDAVKNYGYSLVQRIWKDFLYHQRRWMGNAGGDLRITKDPVRDLGMEYHYEEIDGFFREWYVYIPRRVRENPKDPTPLVFAMHGYSCSGEIYAGHSGWNKVADKYGFILVHPSATNYNPPMKLFGADATALPGWNFLHQPGRPNEINFFKELYERICKEHTIDRTRVYATGHSHGSMMTQTLGMSMPEIFAAIAPCSGVMLKLADEPSIVDLPEVGQRRDLELPVWMFAGEKEEWLIPAIPADDNITGYAICKWRELNHLNPDIPQNWLVGWTVYKDRWHDLIHRNKQGIPLVRYTWIDYFPHAVIPEIAFRIWEEFFSKFSRHYDGTVYQND